MEKVLNCLEEQSKISNYVMLEITLSFKKQYLSEGESLKTGNSLYFPKNIPLPVYHKESTLAGLR
jgi:hypothetical protein